MEYKLTSVINKINSETNLSNEQGETNCDLKLLEEMVETILNETLHKSKQPEILSKINIADSIIAKKNVEKEYYKEINKSLTDKYESWPITYHNLKDTMSTLVKQKCELDDNITKYSKFRFHKEDIERFKTMSKKVHLFKNLLGVKFNFKVTDQKVEGYVFYKDYVKWFSHDKSELDNKQVQKIMWQLIGKRFNGKYNNPWPNITVDSKSIQSEKENY